MYLNCRSTKIILAILLLLLFTPIEPAHGLNNYIKRYGCKGQKVLDSHPLFTPYEGSSLCYSEFNEFASFSYPLKRATYTTMKNNSTQSLEGKVSYFTFLKPDNSGVRRIAGLSW